MPFRFRFSRSVQMIDSDKISGAPSQDLAGLLCGVHSVDIRHHETYGLLSDIGAFHQTLILLIGGNVTIPQA